jgi:hypothetical protein
MLPRAREARASVLTALAMALGAVTVAAQDTPATPASSSPG